MEAINVKLTKTAFKTLKGIKDKWPIIVNEGGSSSGKSYGTIQVLIYIANNTPNIRITVVSHSLPHLKRGVMRDFFGIMRHWQIWNTEQWSATNFQYTFKNGAYIEFVGLEDSTKARGPRRDILFVNEANLITKELFDQLVMRTMQCSIIDLNPADFNCWCYQVADNPSNLRIHSTYKDNIDNLSPNQIAYIEGYKGLPDDFMWKVYGLGERGAAKELIFTHWQKVEQLPDNGEMVIGLDFGFTNPSAMVQIVNYDGEIYMHELLYQSGLTITDLAGYIKALNLGNALIYCDSAEPKSIEELSRHGLNCKPSVKDVWPGIVSMKGYKLHVTKNSSNLQKELSSYKWKVDRDGNLLEEPVKLNDHAIDAARYAIHTHFSQHKQIMFMV